jgi:hypothetical protein
MKLCNVAEIDRINKYAVTTVSFLLVVIHNEYRNGVRADKRECYYGRNASWNIISAWERNYSESGTNASILAP